MHRDGTHHIHEAVLLIQSVLKRWMLLASDFGVVLVVTVLKSLRPLLAFDVDVALC